MAKNNFLLSDEWESMFSALPDEKAGQLIKAAFKYHAGEEASIDDPILDAVFCMVKAKIDENDKKYAEICQKRAEAAKAKDSKSEQMQANATKGEQATPDSECDSDSDNDSDVNIERAKSSRKEKVKKEIGPYISPSGPVRGTTSLADLNEVYLTYLQSRKENKKPLKSETSIRANADKLIRMATANGALDTDKAAAILRQSIENGWQGLFELKEPMETARSGTASGYSGYSFDELEARLGGWA